MDKDSGIGLGFAALVAFGAAVWGSLDGWLKVLCLLTLLDTMAGLSTHISLGTLNRDAFLKGANQKFIMVLLVTASAVIQAYLADTLNMSIPLTLVAAGFYGAREFLSIMKHAAAAGLSIPPGLLEAGEKLEMMAGGAVKRTETSTMVTQTDTRVTESKPLVPPPTPPLGHSGGQV